MKLKKNFNQQLDCTQNLKYHKKGQRNTQGKGKKKKKLNKTKKQLLWFEMVALKEKKKHGSCMVSAGSGEYGQISAHRCVPENTHGSHDLLQPYLF